MSAFLSVLPSLHSWTAASSSLDPLAVLNAWGAYARAVRRAGTARALAVGTGGALHAVVLATGLLLGCADRATIGALCPSGCEPLPEQGICDCSPSQALPDAGVCMGERCLEAGASEAGAVQPAAADGGDVGCTLGMFQLERKRLDLIVVVDDGASLAPWYPQLYEGFRAFLNDQASRGLGVAVLRFGESCAAMDYLPPLVPVVVLPDNIAAIEALLPLAALSTNSTLPALAAAEQHALRWAADHPENRVAVLLLTDASPGACDGLSGNYDMEAPRLAAAAHAGTPSIATYVVAPGSFELVEGIARSGGTELQRLPITATSDDVVAALRVVRAHARPCELALPSGAAVTADSRVVVIGTGGAQTLEIAPDSGSCDRAGFYVADSSLVACPERCAMLDDALRVELAAACAASP